MDDFAQTVAQNAKDLPIEDQQRMGQVQEGAMDDEHKNFLQTVLKLIDEGKINVSDPLSMINHDVYDALDEQWQDKTDLALANIADQLRLITDFYRSTETPNEAPQLQAMIDHLWQMKQRIEEHHDVFIF